MKVLQINFIFGRESTGTIVKDICSEIEKNGNVSYVAYQKTEDVIERGYRIGNWLDWKIHALLTRLTGRQAYYSHITSYLFLRWVKRIGPNIIHVHNLHSNYINLHLLCEFCKKNNIPLVVTLHDCWIFTGKCSHFVRTKCERWKDACGKCTQLHNEVPSWFVDNTSSVLNQKTKDLNSVPKLYIVGCSKWISQCALQSRLMPKRIVTIYNGIDTSIFYPEKNDFKKKYNIENSFVVLGMANKWCDKVNLDGTKKIITELWEKVVFVIVGCSESENYFFADFSNVICLPFIKSREELAYIYNGADVFLNLTRADTLPTVNMESICCGTPVITFDSCGSPELLDIDDGIVVPEGNFDEVIQAIKKIMREGLTYDIEEKQKKFSKDTSSAYYMQLYNEILEKD